MRACEICKKSYSIGGVRKLLRGNYNPTVKKKRKANLQKKRIPSCGRVLICTRCLKTFAKS